MAILVTGGAGFIGSHTCVQLLAAGFEIVIADNLSNSKPHVIHRIQDIARMESAFEQIDVCDSEALEDLFQRYQIDAVIHFAGYKAVGESVREPLKYYRNNLDSTLTLLEVMARHGVKTLVFSSSATVYGDPHAVPITEEFPLSTTNPYGSTKLMIEGILQDLHRSDSTWRIAILRYFNPIGAHESGLLCEDPQGIPNNLMPYVCQVAAGKLPILNVFGNDYPTVDGTGVRDYLHVMDLADGHLAALRWLDQAEQSPDQLENTRKPDKLGIFNLGTGQGTSVLELVETFQRENNIPVPHQIVARRPGDIAACYADPSKAAQELHWRTTRDLAAMCRDAWRAYLTHRAADGGSVGQSGSKT